MVEDVSIQAAVSKIRQRAERQQDGHALVKAFVDAGILPQLDNVNHQILYGRRGTGKTHVLTVLRERAIEQGQLVVFLDCRTLGSTSQFCDVNLPIEKRCLALFRDILHPIYNRILEYIIETQPQDGVKAMEAIDRLLHAITDRVQITTTVNKKVETQTTSSTEGKAALKLGLARSSFMGELGSKDSETIGSKESADLTVTTEDKIQFPSINTFLAESLRLCRATLVLILDEWSVLPDDIQPYLAEFIKRGMLPVNEVTVKIGALEQRSNFSTLSRGRRIGFELGADIAANQDLDEHYVFDKNPEEITDFYADVLRSHLQLELPDGYLRDLYKILTARDFASRLFTERSTFMELGRAAEGVLRDLINVFSIAFFNASKRGRATIDKQAVTEAARQWFEQDKSQYLDDEMQIALQKIVTDVIGQRKARSFLVPRTLEKHPTINKLFDARLIHHVRRGYADKDNPGVRYNIYSLDYGTYVDLLGTSKEPQLNFLETDTVDPDFIVPYDDKRSIRRIVLTEDNLR